MKVRRLLDTLSVLKKSADEIGKLRDKYSGGGMITAVDAEGLGTIHDVLMEFFLRKGDMRWLLCLLYRMCSAPTTSDQDRNRLGWRRIIGVQAVLRRGEGRTNGG